MLEIRVQLGTYQLDDTGVSSFPDDSCMWDSMWNRSFGAELRHPALVTLNTDELFDMLCCGSKSFEKDILSSSPHQASVVASILNYTEPCQGQFIVGEVLETLPTVWWTPPPKPAAKAKSKAKPKGVDFLAPLQQLPKACAPTEPLVRPLPGRDWLVQALEEVMPHINWTDEDQTIISDLLEEQVDAEEVLDCDEDGGLSSGAETVCAELELEDDLDARLLSIGLKDLGGGFERISDRRFVGKVCGPWFGRNTYKAFCEMHSKCFCMVTSRLPAPGNSHMNIVTDLAQWLHDADVSATVHFQRGQELKVRHGMKPRGMKPP